MRDRHNNRPEAVDAILDAVQALLEAATPYFAVSWLNTQAPPYWARTDLPFKAHEGGAVTFFSKRYLDQHRGGRPLEDPPVARELPVAGGQLLVAERRAFGEAPVSALSELREYLQRVQFG